MSGAFFHYPPAFGFPISSGAGAAGFCGALAREAFEVAPTEADARWRIGPLGAPFNVAPPGGGAPSKSG